MTAKSRRGTKREKDDHHGDSRKARKLTKSSSSADTNFLSSLQDLISSHMPSSHHSNSDGDEDSSDTSTNPNEVLMGVRPTSIRRTKSKKQKQRS